MKRNIALRQRLLIYYVVVFSALGVFHWWFYWSPDFVRKSEHFVTESTADEAITDKAVKKAENIYRSYCHFWNVTNDEQPKITDKHKLRIYKSRLEFKSIHPTSGWAEAFYMPPTCYQYINRKAENPYHWMKHEIIHQLHREVSSFKMKKWDNEGLACLFSTAKEIDGNIILGTIDSTTYPIWWIAKLNLTGDMKKDMRDKKIMKLKFIVEGKGGLNMDQHFNLYYIQWYSLVHFLVFGEDGKYRESFKKYVRNKSPIEEFEDYFGALDTIQKQWYDHLKNKICLSIAVQ